ncbi:hypothetical protein AV530_006294 [Patagioenas fasciata monilis]|uniref:Uncharacterized protein n=1 Tax=Patagioenas fasciata monilis TaxID=372326 RepID=A0A1V4KGD2_PATFA|nr:hypothetical protein AV530_006294 [Patagioenas fasciata monilis]
MQDVQQQNLILRGRIDALPRGQCLWDEEDVALKTVLSGPVTPVQSNHLLRQLPAVGVKGEEAEEMAWMCSGVKTFCQRSVLHFCASEQG